MNEKKSSSKPVPPEEGVKKQVDAKKKTKETQQEVKGLDRKELETAIVKLHNEGLTQSGIGLNLKEKHGIKSVKKILGKTILQVLTENKLSPALPEDLTALLRRAVALQKHQKENKKDMTAKRGYQLTVSKIRALAKYYKTKGVLPRDWVYDDKKAALLVK